MKQQKVSQPVRFDQPTPTALATQTQRARNFDVASSLAWNSPAASSADSLPKEIRTIVVPLDGTAYAEHALPAALAIARRAGASLRIIHAYSRLDLIDPWQMSHAAARIKPTEHEKQSYLSRIVRRIARIDSIPVETVLLDGTEKVGALARGASGADLVVLASRRRSLASRLWWNSTFDGLRRQLSIPIQLAQAYRYPVDLTADPIARHILVPLDGSLLSRSILEQAARLARLEGAALTLLNVQNDNWSRGHFDHTNPGDYLLSAMRSLKATTPHVESHVITTQRNTADAIVAFAKQSDVDLIALATRADRGLPRLMRGSIADTLIRRTKLPILVQCHDDRVRRAALTTIV